MTTLTGIQGSTNVDPTGTIPLTGDWTSMSSDSMLAYCQMQLGGLDSQVATQMKAQQQALNERQAVESAEAVLNGFGTAGPTDAAGFQKCYDALTNAANQINQQYPNDPVATQLLVFRDTSICGDPYDFKPARSLTGAETQELAQDRLEQISTVGAPGAQNGLSRQAQNDIDRLNQITAGTFNKPADGQWAGTTQDLTNIAGTIKDGAEIQLLKLQDLVSQRQQAIQLCTSMLTKTDQTLEDESKAVGQG